MLTERSTRLGAHTAEREGANASAPHVQPILGAGTPEVLRQRCARGHLALESLRVDGSEKSPVDRPPSTRSVVPVIHSDSSLHR